MESRIVQPGDAVWERTLVGMPHDIYHLPGYVAHEAERLGGRPVAVLVEHDDSRLLLPLVLRPLPEVLNIDALDAVSPYGYPGPIISGQTSSTGETTHRMVRAAIDTLRSNEVCTAFVRLHPLLDSSPEWLRECGEVVDRGEVVVIDLSLREVELWKQTRKTYRTEISRLEREGFTARVDDSWSRLSEFASMYASTMDRAQADASYRLGEEHFVTMRAVLGTRLHLVVVEKNEHLACAGLFSECGGFVQYLFSGTSDRYLRSGPNRLMLHFVRSWAKRRDNRWFHLGGGLGASGDSLFFFKSGFSKNRRTFRTWHLSIDAGTNLAAQQAWEQRYGVDAPRDFFPAYRAPVPKHAD